MTATNEFFPRDPAQQLVDVKEVLTERLVWRRREVNYARKINDNDQISVAVSVELEARRMENEIQFLEELLDQMERS